MVKGNVTTYDGNGMLAQRLHGNRPFAKDFVHHHGDGSIPRHVAGRAKAIHRNIKAITAPPGTPGTATIQMASNSMKLRKSGKLWGRPFIRQTVSAQAVIFIMEPDM